MLIIRDEQMAAFAAELDARFEEELLEMLSREGAPALEALADDERRTAIREGRLESRRQGLLSEEDARTFVRCVGRHGRGFYRDQPWATILESPSLPPAEKLRRLVAGDV